MPDEIASKTNATLNRTLGLVTATLVVTGIMIGSGIFKKIVPMSKLGLSETQILLVWIIAGFISMLGAFIVAGLANTTEESGGVYEYLRLAFGNFSSFLFGWTDFAIIGSASIAALSFIFAQTIDSVYALPNPLQQWEHISIGVIQPFKSSGVKIIAIVTILFLTWINYKGVKNSGLVNNIVTGAKIIGILTLTIMGLTYVSPETLPNAVTAVAEAGNTNLFAAIFTALLSALWAFDGWYNLSYITGEIKNPKRNIALAIIIGVGAVTLLYLLINFAFMQVLSLDELASLNDNNIGAVEVADRVIGPLGRTGISVLIMLSVFGTLNGSILAHSRVIYRMAQEGYFFKAAKTVHPTNRTPSKALLYTLVWSCILVLSGTFDMLTDMVVFASFLFFVLIALALFKLKKQGKIPEKVIGHPWAAILFLLFSLGLVVNTLVQTPMQSLIGLALICSGIPFYLYFHGKNKL